MIIVEALIDINTLEINPIKQRKQMGLNNN